MRPILVCLLCVMGLVSCGAPEVTRCRLQSGASSIEPAPDAATADAGGQPFDAGPPDAGVVVVQDAGAPLTWERDTKPLFDRHCTRCHESGNWGIPSFADRYPDLLIASKLCVGENVGTCVSRAVRLQRTEGTRCRTYETPFHREGWACLSSEEIATIVRWVDGSMLER